MEEVPAHASWAAECRCGGCCASLRHCVGWNYRCGKNRKCMERMCRVKVIYSAVLMFLHRFVCCCCKARRRGSLGLLHCGVVNSLFSSSRQHQLHTIYWTFWDRSVCFQYLLGTMSSAFEIQPVGRFFGQSAAIKRPKVCEIYAVILLQRKESTQQKSV